MKFGSCMHLSKVTQVCSNQGCMTYFHRIMLMSFWVVSYNIVFTMFYYMSLCNILFLTSLKPLPLHGFASYSLSMFLRWAPSNIVKIRVLPLFFMELWVILCNFWPILKKSSSIKPRIRNHSYLICRVPRGSSFYFVQIRLL